MADSEVRVDVRASTEKLGGDLRSATKKIKEISKAFDDTKKHISGMEKELESVKEQYDELTSGKKVPKSLKDMQSALKDTEREIQKNREASKDLLAEYEAAAKKHESIKVVDLDPGKLDSLKQKSTEARAAYEQQKASLSSLYETINKSVQEREMAIGAALKAQVAYQQSAFDLSESESRAKKEHNKTEKAMLEEQVARQRMLTETLKEQEEAAWEAVKAAEANAKAIAQLHSEPIKEQESATEELRHAWRNAKVEYERYRDATSKATYIAAEQAAAEVDKIAEHLRPFEDKIDELTEKADGLRNSIYEINLTPEASQEAQDLKTRMEALGESIDEANKRKDELQKSVELQQAIETVRKFAASAADLAKKIAAVGIEAAKGFGTVAVYAGRGAKALGSIVLALLGIRKNSKSASSGIRTLSGRLVRLAKNVFVFSMITSGLRKLREGVSALIGTNRELSASLNAIQANLLVAFAPLWEVVEPGLVSFLALLERSTAAVATFFATLGGKTYDEAQTAAQALYEQAKATKKLGDETDNTKGKLAGFDKINQLAQNTSEEKSLDFTTNPPDFSWVDGLKAAMGDWYNIGEFLSDSFTNFLVGIDWGEIQDGAKKLGQNVVDFLNGFLDSPAAWMAVGTTIAAGINTALSFLDTLLAGLNWETFGRNFGAMLNSIVRDFDWELLGNTMGDYVNAVFGFLLRAIETFDWQSAGGKLAVGLLSLTTAVKWDYIALTLAKGLNGVLIYLRTFLVTYPWGELGARFAEFLNLMFASIDWDGVGDTVAVLFNSAISFLHNAVTKFKWSDVGKGVSQAISKLLHDIKWDELGQTVSDFFKGVLEFINTVIQNTDWKAVGESIGEFLINIDWLGIAKGVAAAVAGVFGGFWDMVFGLIKQIPNSVVIIGTVIVTLSSLIKTVISLTSFLSSLVPVITAVKTLWPAITSAFGATVGPIGLVIAAITALITIIVLLVKNWDAVKDAGLKAWEFIKSVWNGSGNWFKNIVTDPIINLFKSLWDYLKKGGENSRTWWESLWSGFTYSVRSFANVFVDMLNGIVKSFWSMINSIIKAINSLPGVKMSQVSYSTIPRLAKGGLAYSETLAVVGDNPNARTDPEVIAPLSKLSGLISEQLNNFSISGLVPSVAINAIAERGGNQGGVSLSQESISGLAQEIAGYMSFIVPSRNSDSTDSPIELVLQLDGTTLGRVVVPIINKENARRGGQISGRLIPT